MEKSIDDEGDAQGQEAQVVHHVQRVFDVAAAQHAPAAQGEHEVHQDQHADQYDPVEAQLFDDRQVLEIFHAFPSCHRSVAACMIFSCVASAISISAVLRPSHMTTMRSDMRKISVISEEIMMMDLPSAASSFIRW